MASNCSIPSFRFSNALSSSPPGHRKTSLSGSSIPAINSQPPPGWPLDIPLWPEPVDGKQLLDSIVQILKRFVVLPPWASETLALWIVHTYAFQLRDVSTYIGIESPEPRCGKTT